MGCSIEVQRGPQPLPWRNSLVLTCMIYPPHKTVPPLRYSGGSVTLGPFFLPFWLFIYPSDTIEAGRLLEARQGRVGSRGSQLTGWYSMQDDYQPGRLLPSKPGKRKRQNWGRWQAARSAHLQAQLFALPRAIDQNQALHGALDKPTRLDLLPGEECQLESDRSPRSAQTILDC